MKFKIIPNQQTPAIIQNNFLSILACEKFLSFAMRQKNHCVGLAANQVSLDGQRFNVNMFAIKYNHQWDIILSPRILEFYGKPEIKIEKCLTWLGKKIEAERYNSIYVEYLPLRGGTTYRKLYDLEAQIFQHEYNHLMGIEEKVIGF
jgi:peptide deformylase